MKLEKIVSKRDLIFMGVAVGLAAIGTGICAGIENANTLKEAFEISTPIPWSESYQNSWKTFFDVAKYTLPVSIIAGYSGSRFFDLFQKLYK